MGEMNGKMGFVPRNSVKPLPVLCVCWNRSDRVLAFYPKREQRRNSCYPLWAKQMADVSRIFALGAQKQAQEMTWRDFEGDFSETTFMDQVTMPAMLKGMPLLRFVA